MNIQVIYKHNYGSYTCATRFVMLLESSLSLQVLRPLLSTI